MHRLRTSPFLARLVLAWFLGVVWLAGAAPLIHPQSLELVCGASGAVKLVVVSAAGDDESTPRPQALGPHGLDCSLCLQLQAPPPSLPPVALPRLDEECALAGAPRIIPFGPVMVAPVIMAFGNAEQQKRFLPGIASGEVWWSQGYSEPGSGSDLASVKTRAERVGDKYIVNGQKTWTTLGQHGDWMFNLVRTRLNIQSP
eukprot:gene1120-1488_t